jgi:hypothetical protein
MKYIFIVGETIDAKKQMWNFHGAYSSIKTEIEKCVEDNFFIAIVEIDFDEPRKLRQFELSYYPRLENMPNTNI